MSGLKRTGKPSLDIPHNHLILEVPLYHPTFPSHSRTSSVTEWTSSKNHLFYFQASKIVGPSTWWAELSAFQFWASVSHSSTLPLPKGLWVPKSQHKWWAFRMKSGSTFTSTLYFPVTIAKSNQHEKHYVWVWRKSNMALLVLPKHLRALTGLGRVT